MNFAKFNFIKVKKYICIIIFFCEVIKILDLKPYFRIIIIYSPISMFLKQVNPKARIGVKLVASSGSGTIAAVVAKAKADIILISGHNGGTGATPQTSVKYVGIPWEMGLTEANQVLTLNNLRHKVTLRTDGGIKTGRDVVIAAMMGAEEYGVATTALVAMGCIMVRQCHSNTCPVGVCTQDEKLREKFTGTPDKVVNLFRFIGEEVREILAELGFKSLNEVIGRTDLLRQISKASPNLDDLDLNPLFVQTDAGDNTRYCTTPEINEVPDTLDQEILPEIKDKIGKVKVLEKEFIIKNIHRTVGTRISNHLYEKYGSEALEANFLTLNFKGTAGQSFGAFGLKGLKLILKGDANDYVGKGLSGATIVVKLPDESNLVSYENTIIGNTVLYGATSGKLFAAGQAGERYAVRNSGSVSVIEGCDSNACEYMTGGTVVVLGDVGDNFGAGMTGGMAFVYNINNEFDKKANPESIIWQTPETEYWINYLKGLIKEHHIETNSNLSKKIIENFDKEVLREYDIRGIVGDNINENTAYTIGRTFGFIVKKKLTSNIIATGYDGRLTSPVLHKALCEGLRDSGAKVINIGMGPTPMTYFAHYHLNADAAIMVTGSHRKPDNHKECEKTWIPLLRKMGLRY